LTCSCNLHRYDTRLKAISGNRLETTVVFNVHKVGPTEFRMTLKKPVWVPVDAETSETSYWVHIGAESGQVLRSRYRVTHFKYAVGRGQGQPHFRFETDPKGPHAHGSGEQASQHLRREDGSLALDIHNMTCCIAIAITMEYARSELSPVDKANAALYQGVIDNERGEAS